MAVWVEMRMKDQSDVVLGSTMGRRRSELVVKGGPRELKLKASRSLGAEERLVRSLTSGYELESILTVRCESDG